MTSVTEDMKAMDDTTGAVLWRPTEDIIRNAALIRKDVPVWRRQGS